MGKQNQRSLKWSCQNRRQEYKSMKNRAFSIVELLISLTLLAVVSIGFFSAFRFYQARGLSSTEKAINLNAMRSSLDKLKQDLLISKGLYDNDYSKVHAVNEPFNVYQTKDNQLIVKIPSVYSTNEFIDVADSEYTDYYFYYLSSGELIRKTFRSTKTGSARPTDDYVLAKGLKSIRFSDGLNTLGTLSSEKLLSIRHIQIVITAEVQNTLNGNPQTETLTLNVSFRNYM